MARLERQSLAEVHRRIAACRTCQDLLDPTKVPRVTLAGPTRSPLFIVSQALADTSQRRSGVPYFLPNGRLSPTGGRLEQFLNRIGCTLHPPGAIALPKGSIAAKPDLSQVYNSEIIQCFPGRVGAGKGDQFPREVARRCLDHQYMEREIELVDPRVILVLGSKAGQAFFDRFGPSFGKLPPIGKTLLPFDANVVFKAVEVAGSSRVAVVLIHPSGMTAGLFNRSVTENVHLCDALRAAITPSDMA